VRLDALYVRRNEYVQGKIDNGKLVSSNLPLQTNELVLVLLIVVIGLIVFKQKSKKKDFGN